MSAHDVRFSGFERSWHWAQAAVVLVLAATGFEVHGSIELFGYEDAVRVHTLAGGLLIALTALALFGHRVTGASLWPAKLEPMQRLAYAGVMAVVLPALLASGALYALYHVAHRHGIHVLDVAGLEGLAVTHTAAAYLLVAFLVVHVYMITTGARPTTHLAAMLTGEEER